jgi:hypothetical protein
MSPGKCKLCLREKVELQDSHFIPAAAYRVIQRSTNSAPVVVRNEIAIQRNEQTTDYVLCRDCEQLFNRGGEDWVMDNCNRPDKGFRLQEIINGMQPIAKRESTTFYSTANISEIDVEKLTYFVSSVMWRGSAHSWRSGGKRRETPNLGPYEEMLRRYLLGETGFPSDASIWINVVTDAGLQTMVNDPYGGKMKNEQYWLYKFIFLGIGFEFFLGKAIPKVIRISCSYRSAEKYIFVSDQMNDMIIRDFGAAIMRAKPVGSLRGRAVK